MNDSIAIRLPRVFGEVEGLKDDHDKIPRTHEAAIRYPAATCSLETIYTACAIARSQKEVGAAFAAVL